MLEKQRLPGGVRQPGKVCALREPTPIRYMTPPVDFMEWPWYAQALAALAAAVFSVCMGSLLSRPEKYKPRILPLYHVHERL